MYENILNIKTRQEFRKWLQEFSGIEKECYVFIKKVKPINENYLWYLDAVEEALCFGWIDSTLRIINGCTMLRFSLRRKNSHWTELNKERVCRLKKLGLMTEFGMLVVPPLNEEFKIDEEIKNELIKANVLNIFQLFHPLYQRVRISNLIFYREYYPKLYDKKLQHFIKKTTKGKMYGEWNDYGRLLDY